MYFKYFLSEQFRRHFFCLLCHCQFLYQNYVMLRIPAAQGVFMFFF
jgi:hypothetical protein